MFFLSTNSLEVIGVGKNELSEYRKRAKQVLRSTIRSSTIVSFFFDNARRGRF
jgi:hypothetical protein